MSVSASACSIVHVRCTWSIQRKRRVGYITDISKKLKKKSAYASACVWTYRYRYFECLSRIEIANSDEFFAKHKSQEIKTIILFLRTKTINQIELFLYRFQYVSIVHASPAISFTKIIIAVNHLVFAELLLSRLNFNK